MIRQQASFINLKSQFILWLSHQELTRSNFYQDGCKDEDEDLWQLAATCADLHKHRQPRVISRPFKPLTELSDHDFCAWYHLTKKIVDKLNQRLVQTMKQLADATADININNVTWLPSANKTPQCVINISELYFIHWIHNPSIINVNKTVADYSLNN